MSKVAEVVEVVDDVDEVAVESMSKQSRKTLTSWRRADDGVPDGVSQWGKIEDKSVSHRNTKGDDECAVDARRRPSAAEERPQRERARPQQSPQPEEEEEGQSAK
ncbi:hypothetical protein CBR_g64835 [Chara braunii]|uniref:Uncharacterized protein n=1 Tax=Chara braunii TaxID=69332 RepID=A0A388K911_CHABU|nr:hypothetical protein CBR_g64835 [Chara braunii]|eukprot:GBG66564.1 hypothetical protein CBR_g64835 [Chara braunii]